MLSGNQQQRPSRVIHSVLSAAWAISARARGGCLTTDNVPAGPLNDGRSGRHEKGTCTMRILPRRLFVFGGAIAVAAGGFAYMASNSVATTNAGEGAGAVSGYTVYNVHYTGLTSPNGGVSLPNNDYTETPTGSLGNTGSMGYLGAPTVNGLQEQDGVTSVSFQLSPDNATWAAVQLYNAGGTVIGGGGASNCGETGGWWTCIVGDTGADSTSGGPVPVSDIAYLDGEAAQ